MVLETDRFLLEVGGAPPLDTEGFLEVPPPDAWWITPDSRPIPAGELVGSAGFALLAIAGAGKSTLLNSLQSREPISVEIDLRTLDAGGIAAALDIALAQEGPVYLDSIDEAALLVPSLFRILEQRLSTPDAARIPWRLACRPAAWNQHFARVLKQHLPTFREFHLLPVTRDAAKQIASALGTDPDAFVEAIANAHLGRLSATPGRLRAVAEQWHATSTLPTDSVEAMQFEVAQLLEEPDAGRPQPALAIDRRLRVAQRLGAISIFCGVARFSTADAAGTGVAPVAGLPSRPEPDDTGAPIGPEDYRAVVGTALFGPAADAALAFRHQQYAEFLAGSYLVNRDIGRPSLRALLSAAEDNLLPGTMAGVTSWLMALNRELTAELVASNALQLARTGLELPDDNARAVLTEALLDRAAAGDIDPEWGLDLEPLANARLAGQLRQSIAEGIHCSEHLWWVASLATAGSCADLAGELLVPTMDPRWMPWARGAGVQAIRILGDRELRARLRSLLSLDDQEDPDDELLADAIEALYPELLQTAEMLASLRPRRNDHLIGGYVMLLRRLPAMVPDQDLPTALLWLAERVGATRDAYGQLPVELIRRGWHASSTDAVLHALAAVLGQVARTDARFDFRHAAHPWDGVEPNDRRRLAVVVAAELNAESGWWSLFKLGLINGDDAMWLVDELPGIPENARPSLASCLPQVVGEPTLELADKIYNLDPTHPAYEATQWLRTPVSLDSETARRWQRIRAEDRAEADMTLDPVRQQGMLLDALGEAERDPAEWWKVLYWLSVEDGHTGDSLFAHDLTRRPGWTLLSDADRTRVLDIGLQHASNHYLHVDNWRGKSQIQDLTALRDWGPVYLLTTLAKHEPHRVQELDVSAWDRLSAAIVGAWNFDHDEDAGLRADLLRLAPSEGRQSFVTAALADLDANVESGRSLSQRSVYAALMSDMATVVAAGVAEGRYSDHQTGELLDLLADHSPNEAVATARRLLNEHGGSHERASRLLARLDAAAVIDDLTASEEGRRAQLLQFVPELNLNELDTERLSRLAQMLLDEFPIGEDPPTPYGAYRPDAAYETRDARSSALSMLAERGEAVALDVLATGRSGADLRVLMRLRRLARGRAVDLAMEPVTPAQLMALLERGDLRLVRSDRDLLEAVLEQLAALQHEITHSGAFRDLWNESRDDPPRPKREDDISDWVQRQLRTRLSGLILDREVQVERPHAGGIGTRIDLSATAATGQLPARLTRIGVEAKLVDHRQLLTALASQLVDRYLGVMGREHGIYLVYWVAPAQRPDSWVRGLPDSASDLLAELERQAAQVLPEFHVRPYVLDISRP